MRSPRTRGICLLTAAAYGAAFDADPPFGTRGAARERDSREASGPGASDRGVYRRLCRIPGDNRRPARSVCCSIPAAGGDILWIGTAARRLHLPVIAHSYVRGVSGQEKSDTLKAQDDDAGRLTYKSIKIKTAGALQDTGDGILGRRHSSGFGDHAGLREAHRDARARVRRKIPARPLPGDGSVALPFRFYHGDLYVQLALNGIPVWTCVDTGAYTTTLSLRLAQQQLEKRAETRCHGGSYSGKRGVGNSEAEDDLRWHRVTNRRSR